MNCQTGDLLYFASREDCINISTSVCAGPWNFASSLSFGDRLPKCDSLPYSR